MRDKETRALQQQQARDSEVQIIADLKHTNR
jgi:hypothetical protein